MTSEGEVATWFRNLTETADTWLPTLKQAREMEYSGEDKVDKLKEVFVLGSVAFGDWGVG